MPAHRELDVRAPATPSQQAEILEAFDALAADESLVVVADHDPRPLLSRFQGERAGRFDWNVLEAGPVRHRVEIRRRASEGPRNVTEYLQSDHQRLDALLADVQRALTAGAFGQASERFAEFVCGLGRHIDVEEQVLFPTFEQLTGMTGGGPTFVMRREHVEIRKLLEAGAAALRASEAAGARGALGQLVDLLALHNLKEERVLYPTTDQALGDDRSRTSLVERLQAF